MPETSLHAELKSRYAQPDGIREALVADYQIDAIQGDTLIEIQTGNFSAIRKKLAMLLPEYPILLVYPIALEKWVVKLSADGNESLYRRKSPRHGRIEDLFGELIRMPHLVVHPNFQIEVLLVREEEIRLADGKGSWRRKGVSIADHRLIEIVSAHRFSSPKDYLTLLPDLLLPTFTAQDLAKSLAIRHSLAYKMAYCLRKMGMMEVVGKRGRSNLYALLTSVYNA
jgi:hypothetical protein